MSQRPEHPGAEHERRQDPPPAVRQHLAKGEPAREDSVSGSRRSFERSEAALELIQKVEQANALPGAIALSDRGLPQDAGLLETSYRQASLLVASPEQVGCHLHAHDGM